MTIIELTCKQILKKVLISPKERQIQISFEKKNSISNQIKTYYIKVDVNNNDNNRTNLQTDF